MVEENQQHNIQFASNRWLARMELELRVNEYGRIVPGETSEQNYGSQYFHQPDVLNQAFPDIPMNPDIHNTIPTRSESEAYDWKQYKNQYFHQSDINQYFPGVPMNQYFPGVLA